ncbi:MAG: hypothetical protein HY265_03120, partial [Deltaproteobacteria bacterium]|nr:hypothetical protein [Deltaproteobacteria bacterium]
PQEIESTPHIQESAGMEFIKGVVHHKERLIMLLNLAILFNMEDIVL